MAKPADLSGSRAVLPYLISWSRGLPRLGTSSGREERQRGTNGLEVQNANFLCFLLPRVSCRRCKVRLLHLVLRDARTSLECQNLSGAFVPCDPGCELPARGATRTPSCSVQTPGVGGRGRGALALLLRVPWHLTRTAFCLMQDLGALSPALGSARRIPGGLGVQPEPRAAHAATAWSQPLPLASSPIRPDFTTSESCLKRSRDRLLIQSLRSKPLIVIKLKSLSLI